MAQLAPELVPYNPCRRPTREHKLGSALYGLVMTTDYDDPTAGVTDADRERAFANIKAAARHYDVEVSATRWQDLGKPSDK